MRVPQRLDYAMRTLVLLAAQPKGTYTAAGDLADRLGLPRRFVEQQLTELARAGIVTSRRGPAGGCTLVSGPGTITALDVVVALQGVVMDIPRQPDSAVAALWQGMSSAAGEHLASITLEALLASQRELDAANEPMYYI